MTSQGFVTQVQDFSGLQIYLKSSVQITIDMLNENLRNLNSKKIVLKNLKLYKAHSDYILGQRGGLFFVQDDSSNKLLTIKGYGYKSYVLAAASIDGNKISVGGTFFYKPDSREPLSKLEATHIVNHDLENLIL